MRYLLAFAAGSLATLAVVHAYRTRRVYLESTGEERPLIDPCMLSVN